MLRTLVPRAFATLRTAAHHVNRLAFEPGQLLDFAALEDRVLLNAAPVDASVDGGDAGGGEAAGPDAGGGWIVVEDYSGTTTDVHDPQSGGWDIVNGEYEATPGSDAVSTLNFGGPLGENLELEVSINADNASGPNLSNAFVIFDYHSATDFKFAGAYVGVDQWVIGHRTAGDWVTDSYVVSPIHALTDYKLSLHVAGDSQVTLHVDGSPVVTHTFADSVTDGQLGVGTKSAIARFDDLRLRFLPSGTGGSPGELPLFEDFDDAVADHFSSTEGDWQLVDGHYQVTPEVGETGASVVLLAGGVPDDVEVAVTFGADPIVPNRFSNGVIIFDYQSETDFKYAGGFVNRDQWVIGHKTGTDWVDDAIVAATLEPLTEYGMRIVIEDASTVTLFTEDLILASLTFADSLTDGALGLGSNNSVTRFDNFSVVDLSPAVSNITAALDGSDLVVSGHAAGELLVQAQSSNTFNIYDGDDLLYEAFEVNGNLRFDLGEWDDHVTLDLNGHTFGRNVFVGLGEGGNYFEVMGGTIAKSLHVLAGSGQDQVVIADSMMVGKHVDVDLGGGANHFTSSHNQVGGHLKVTGGDEHDAVAIEGAQIGGTLRLNLGDGGSEVHVADAKVGGHLKVKTGAGADSVSIAEGVKVGHQVKLSTGAGDDVIAFGGKAGWGLIVHAGDGEDSLLVTGSVCGCSLVHMGAGDDRVEVAEGGWLGKYAEVRLGAGDDTFSGPAGRHCRTVYGGRGDDTIDWFGKSKSHRAYV